MAPWKRGLMRRLLRQRGFTLIVTALLLSTGIDAEKKRVWYYNSWGPAWGGCKNGTFYFSWKTLARLLGERGDATFPRTA